jgi:serine/threonine-protein kinase
LSKPLAPADAVAIVKQAAAGLFEIHQQDWIHRDVKPSNLLLFDGGVVKLTDFGITKSRENIARTRTGFAMGTPEYMSPEQAEGSRDIDARSDIYSLGIVLYELLTGTSPFKRDTPIASALAHTRGSRRPPSALNPAIDATLNAIVMTCMQRQPGRRYRSVRDFYEALNDWEGQPAATDGVS